MITRRGKTEEASLMCTVPSKKKKTLSSLFKKNTSTAVDGDVIHPKDTTGDVPMDEPLLLERPNFVSVSFSRARLSLSLPETRAVSLVSSFPSYSLHFTFFFPSFHNKGKKRKKNKKVAWQPLPPPPCPFLVVAHLYVVQSVCAAPRLLLLPLLLLICSNCSRLLLLFFSPPRASSLFLLFYQTHFAISFAFFCY